MSVYKEVIDRTAIAVGTRPGWQKHICIQLALPHHQTVQTRSARVSGPSTSWQELRWGIELLMNGLRRFSGGVYVRSPCLHWLCVGKSLLP